MRLYPGLVGTSYRQAAAAPEFGQKSQAALPEPKASLPLPAQRPTAPTPSAGDAAARTIRVVDLSSSTV